MNHSLGFLIMMHDNSDGQFVLAKDVSVSIDWPGAPKERMYSDADDILKPAVEAIGGTYIKNPWWTNPFLTISMFAERAAEFLRAELGLPGFDTDIEADDRV